MLPAVRSLYIFLQAGLMWTASRADASFCTKDQVSKCKAAVIDGTLDSLAEGGVCKPNKYVEYTHECAVTNYLPSADYCCCNFDHKVFCCRYHYDWNYFRCDEDEDTIYSLTVQPLAIEILIPAIVVPSVAVLCFIFYCIKCCCCNDDDDDDDDGKTCSWCNCCKRRRRRRREKAAPIRTDGPYTTAPDSQRSNLLPQLIKHPSTTSSSRTEKYDSLFDFKHSVEIPNAQPSAPPYDAHPPPYNPDLYGTSSVDYAPMPYISCPNEHGHSVIYQPVITHAQMPLPITKLTEYAMCSIENDSSVEIIKEAPKDDR